MTLALFALTLTAGLVAFVWALQPPRPDAMPTDRPVQGGKRL
jgi:hypothetical protein